MFSCEICEVFNDTCFEEYLRTTASVVLSFLFYHWSELLLWKQNLSQTPRTQSAELGKKEDLASG